MDFGKGSPIFNAYGDWYGVVKKYWEPPEHFTEEYWDRVMDDIKAFIRKNKGLDQRYVEGMTVPLIRRLERIERERRDKANGIG